MKKEEHLPMKTVEFNAPCTLTWLGMPFIETSAKTGFHVDEAFSLPVLIWLNSKIIPDFRPKKSFLASCFGFGGHSSTVRLKSFSQQYRYCFSCCIIFLCSGIPRTGANSPAKDLPPDIRQTILLLAFPYLHILQLLCTVDTPSTDLRIFKMLTWQHIPKTQ